ncbi:MAG TPA: ABC transporter permease subunit [Gemmataceae bacterium]|nr:ABC transporter permease subunit [Gemmataceae bacterium]
MSVLIDVGRTWLKQTFTWSNTRRAWVDRLAGTGLIVCFALLAWYSHRLSATQLVSSFALLAALAAFMLRRGWIHLFGPILFYDLVRTARRTRYFVIRYLCLLTLVGLFFFVHWASNSGNPSNVMTTSEAQNFTFFYFLVFVVVQSVFLIMLAPAYVAGSIAEEKERKTLEFILATDLHNREIVFGKLVSRIANLMILFMSGLPILSIMQFMGGVDPTLIVAWAAATAIGLVSICCLSMLNSVLNRRPRDAIALSYFCVLGYLILSGASWMFKIPAFAPAWINSLTLEKCLYVGSTGNPLAMAILAADELNIGHSIDSVLTTYVRDFAIFHLTLALICSVFSVLLLRRFALRQATAEPRSRFRIRWPRPRVTSEPLLWKEVFVEKGLHVNFLGRIIFCLLLAVAGAALWYSVEVENRASLRDVIASWIQVVGMLGACLLLLTVAGRAATSLSNERDKETLDGLLTAPVSTNSILFAKWIGAMLSIRWGVFCLTLIYLLGVWQGAVHWITVPLQLLAWTTYTAVVAILGLWYSVVCRSSTGATVWTYLSTAGLGVGHWLDMLCMIPLFFAGQYEPLRYLVLMQAGFTPPYALALSFFVDTSPRSPDAADQIFYGLAGLAAWLMIAGVLWLMTSSRFQLMCGRSTLLESPADPERVSLEPATEGGLAAATNG